MGVGGDDVNGDDGGEDARKGDKADAGANDGGSIAGEGRRRPGGGREVEWEDIKEGVGDLATVGIWRFHWEGWRDKSNWVRTRHRRGRRTMNKLGDRRSEDGYGFGLGLGFTYREDCDGSGREHWQVLFL